MLKIKDKEEVKSLSRLLKIPKGTFLVINGKIEKVLKIEQTALSISLETIRPEQKEFQLGGYYVTKTYYNFQSKKDFKLESPENIISSKVGEEYYKDLKKQFN